MPLKSAVLHLSISMLSVSCFGLKAGAQLHEPLSKLWTGEAWFQQQPETIGNFGDHMHFLSMFWDSNPVDTPGAVALSRTGAKAG